MGILFFDTSALVKRYHEEGTDRVDQLIADENTVVISSLSIPQIQNSFPLLILLAITT
jgi:predicted nucleic acid-binding protein